MTAQETRFDQFYARFEEYRDAIRTHAARELAYLVALGLIDESVISLDDLFDEAVLEAWNQRNRRPPHVPDRQWLFYTVRCALARLARQARPMSTDASLEDVLTDPEMDDQLWAYWEPDEVNTLEDTVPDENGAVVEDTALREVEAELAGTVLPTLPALQRDAFHFYLVEGKSLEEVAERLQTSPNIVVQAAETARAAILQRLGR